MTTRNRNDRYLYLGGPVETARTRACFLAVVMTLLYASCLFGSVLLAHAFADRAVSARTDVPASIKAPHHG